MVTISAGVIYALAAPRFGVSTPLSELLLGSVDPVAAAGLLYLDSGCGPTLGLLLRFWVTGTDSQEASSKRAGLPWLAGAISFGGVAGPVLLMPGVRLTCVVVLADRDDIGQALVGVLPEPV